MTRPVRVPRNGLVAPGDRRERRVPARVRGQIERLLISSSCIRARVRQLAAAIAAEARRSGRPELHLVAVLKGAAAFATDLAAEVFRAGGPPVRFNFIKASSYGNATVHHGEVKIEGQIPYARGKDLLIVEDIVDTGLTISRLQRYLERERKAASVRICALLNKPDRRLPALRKSLRLDYCGFDIPDLFVAGYGLDCAEHLRELPYIVVVNEEYFRRLAGGVP
mgnify:CR=1 FL=1